MSKELIGVKSLLMDLPGNDLGHKPQVQARSTDDGKDSVHAFTQAWP